MNTLAPAPASLSDGTRRHFEYARGAVVFIVACVAILLLAAWVRYCFYWLFGGGEPDFYRWSADQGHLGAIARMHYAWALRVANGEAYTNLAYPPGLVLLIAAYMKLGIESPQVIRALPLALDATAALAVIASARLVGLSRAAAVLTGGAYAILTPAAQISALLNAEAFSGFFFFWFLAAVLYASERQSLAAAIVAGACTGCGALFRPDLLFLAPAGFVWLLIRAPDWSRRSLLRPVALLLTTAIILAPWGWHNWRTHGAFIVTSTSGGNTLYQGLGVIANKHGIVPSDVRADEMAKAAGVERLGVDGDRHFKKLWLDIVRSDPSHFVAVALHRWKLILHHGVDWVQAGGNDLMQRLAAHAPLLILLSLAFSALLARSRPLIPLFVVAPLAYACLSVGLVHYEPRYAPYASLTYFLAPIALVDIGLALSARGLGHVARFQPARVLERHGFSADHAGAILAGLAVALCVLIALPGLRALGHAAGLARQEATIRNEVRDLHAKGALPESIVSLAPAEKLAPVELTPAKDGAWTILTPESINDPLLRLRVASGRSKGIVIVGTGAAIDGGLMINISAGGQSQTAYLVDRVGYHRFEMVLQVFEGKDITIDILNYNFTRYPKPARTRIDLRLSIFSQDRSG